ncbi:hypothetical protein [Aquidulcibacter sp.]|jgi:hypothetical protein|nr:hypothetical protein [Aquidulcibacter sp.]
MSDAIHDRTWEHLRVSTSGAIVEVAQSRPDARNALNGVLMGETS